MNYLKVGYTNLFVPEAMQLAKTLEDGLKESYKEATVEWVECPDLTQEPFNLAAPGLCGDPILLELGGMSCLFPRPCVPFTYNFNKLLKTIYTKENIFIIGGSVYPRESSEQFGDLIVNASFSQTNKCRKINNQSYLAFLDKNTEMCALEPVSDSDSNYYPYGNMFISEGKRRPVLKVWAKGRIHVHFIAALQSALYYEYSYKSLNVVGLGGTFVMKNGKAKCHVLPYSWDARLKTAEDIAKWLHYFKLEAPLVAVGTLFSNNKITITKNEHYNLTESRFHAFSCEKKSGGRFYMDEEMNDTVEYLGYFNPARMLYFIASQSAYDELQDFSELL